MSCGRCYGEIMENLGWLIPIFIIVFVILRQQRLKIATVRHHLNRKKQNKEKRVMEELAKQFVGKECLIYTVIGTDSVIKGTVKEVSAGGIVLENKDGIEAVNLEYVTRIREWPRNAKGKKKQLFV